MHTCLIHIELNGADLVFGRRVRVSLGYTLCVLDASDCNLVVSYVGSKT
jgi:hypothetical protein